MEGNDATKTNGWWDFDDDLVYPFGSKSGATNTFTISTITAATIAVSTLVAF